jgi:hypothetical protein
LGTSVAFAESVSASKASLAAKVATSAANQGTSTEGWSEARSPATKSAMTFAIRSSETAVARPDSTWETTTTIALRGAARRSSRRLGRTAPAARAKKACQPGGGALVDSSRQ